MNILDQSQKLREKVIEDLLTAIPDIEKRILSGVFALLDKYEQSNGKFVFSDMNRKKVIEIQNKIEDILKSSGYFKSANIYVNSLPKITANTMALHENFNSLDLQKKSLTNIEKVFRDNVVSKLNEAGLNENFVGPVTNSVNEAITFGYSIEKTRDNLKDFVIGSDPNSPGGKLGRYLTTTSRDTVTQLQGAQHQAIRNELEMPWVRYVGGTIKDSRAQCVRWNQMEYIAFADLEEEIQLALKNQRARKKDGLHRWSGMIEKTTADNFLIYRGGWGCLQQAIPVRKNPKQKK